MKPIAILAIVLALGCAHVETPRPVITPATIDLGRVTMHVVPGPAFMPAGCQSAAKDQGGCLAGCAAGKEIWVIGYDTPDGMAVRLGVVMHELLHVAHWSDGRVADPDGDRR